MAKYTIGEKTTKPWAVKIMGFKEVKNPFEVVRNQPVYEYNQDKVEADSPYFVKHKGHNIPVFDTVIEARDYKGGSNDAFHFTIDLDTGGRKTFYMPVYMPRGTA